MTDLENAMEALILVFHRYAKAEGDKRTLTKKELKKLMETELPNFLKTQNDPKAVDRIMNDLDANNDDRLDFEEFLPFVAGLSLACERCYNMSQRGKK